MKKNLGILLGRLSKKKTQKLQSFPLNYKYDLYLIKKIGLKNIEWLIDTPDLSNPIFKNRYNKNLKYLLKKYKLNINSAILHFLIDENYFKDIKKEKFNLLNKMLQDLINSKINNIILPVTNFDISLITFLSSFCKINKDQIKNKNLLIESNESPIKIINKITKYKLKSVFLLYDIGNYSNLKRNIIDDIKKYHKYIKEFHLKDKLKDQNVIFGQGVVDFKNFFIVYEHLKLKIPLILENYVGNKPYINTKKQLKYISDL